MPALAIFFASPGLTEELGDQWVKGAVEFPAFLNESTFDTAGFEELRAEYLAGQLKVWWPAGVRESLGNVTLLASEDAPGNWAARDWRPYEMNRSDSGWHARLPVSDLDSPVVYFLLATPDDRGGEREGDHAERNGALVPGWLQRVASRSRYSPMRVARVRELGMEEPTRLFFPFVEGFEEDTLGWRLEAGEDLPKAFPLSGQSHNGRHAGVVELPQGKTSVRVETTRLRGWEGRRQGAVGVRLWLRAAEGAGKVRFWLQARSGEDQPLRAHYERWIDVDSAWRGVDLLFGDFEEVPLVSVDMLGMEFQGREGQVFLVDDLQWLGPWRLLD